MPSPVDLNLVLTIIHRVCANRDWQLLTMPGLGLSETDFAQRIIETLTAWQITEGHAQVTDPLIDRAMVHEYCKVLHEAVGRAQTQVQQRALVEVWNFVTPIIRKYLGDGEEAGHCAYEVVARVWEKRADVRSPGTFLGYAATIARNAALQHIRRKERVEHLQECDDDSDLVWEESFPSTDSVDEQLIEDEELRRSLGHWQHLIQLCLHLSPRRAEVFISLALHEHTVAEVAQRLKMTAANVYVLKHRAVERLLKCVEFMQSLEGALIVLRRRVD